MSNGVMSLSGKEGSCRLEGELYCVLGGRGQTLYFCFFFQGYHPQGVKSKRENSVSASSYRVKLYTVQCAERVKHKHYLEGCECP